MMGYIRVGFDDKLAFIGNRIFSQVILAKVKSY